MGRTEAPLEPDGSAAVECAIWLRQLRREAGLTYPEIAERTHYAASSLQGACAGRRLPSKKITLAFVEACGGDVAAWERYWRQLQRLGTEPERTPEELRPPWVIDAAVRSATDGLATEAYPAIDAQLAAEVAGLTEQPVNSAAVQSVAGSGAVTGRAVASEQPGSGSTAVQADPRAASGRLRRALGFAAAAALFAAGLGVGHLLFPSRHPTVSGGTTSVASVWEREMQPGGVASYRQPGDTGATGPAVTYGAMVRISCAVVTPPESPAPVSNLWLRVQSAPWDGRYYVPAADFLLAAKSGTTAVALPSC